MILSDLRLFFNMWEKIVDLLKWQKWPQTPESHTYRNRRSVCLFVFQEVVGFYPKNHINQQKRILVRTIKEGFILSKVI